MFMPFHSSARNVSTTHELGFDCYIQPDSTDIRMDSIGHFLNRQGCHQTRLLALRRQLGYHSGGNFAVTLLEVVREREIEDQVGPVISDNATTNDTCLQHFY